MKSGNVVFDKFSFLKKCRFLFLLMLFLQREGDFLNREDVFLNREGDLSACNEPSNEIFVYLCKC